MEKSLNCFLKWTLLIAIIGLASCEEEGAIYQRNFSKAEKKELAKRLKDGIEHYYQGTAAQQLLLEEARSFDPTNANIYREIGVPYLKRGIASEFNNYYGKSAEMDPLNWQGWRGYLYLFFYRDYERALADFDATDILTPNMVDYPQSLSVNYLRGICYLQLQQFDNALQYFDQHIKHEGETSGLDYVSPQSFLYKGIAHFNKKEAAAAEAAFQQGLANDGENADLLYWLAKLKLEEGNKKAAFELVGQAKTQFAKGNYNSRPYVEEFYQIYLSDLTELEKDIRS